MKISDLRLKIHLKNLSEHRKEIGTGCVGLVVFVMRGI